MQAILDWGLDTGIKTIVNVAHRVPYGYGDWAVELATTKIHDYQQYSAEKAIAQGKALEIAKRAVARGEQISVYPEWCELHGSRLLAYVCESYLDSPIWCTVFILDGIALWLIICILLRQRQQNQEDKAARLRPPRSVRVRRWWSTLRMVVRITSFNASLPSAALIGHSNHKCKSKACKEGENESVWKKSWDQMATARDHRKKYLWKKEYDLMGVMGRGLGPIIMIACHILISYCAHGWFTLVLPSFGLPDRAYWFIAALTAVVPFRIYLDFLRTSFMDPGSPEASSSSSAPPTNGSSCKDELELAELAEGENIKRCRKCGGPKPRRCHHCKVCRRCVLKMDHHCPFVNNCVGLRNHRFFILFLLELVLGCTVLVCLMIPQLIVALRGAPGQTLANRIHVITVFAVALIADSMLAPFFYFHMQLVVVNETTLENMKSRNQRMVHRMKQKQFQHGLKRAEKAGDEAKMEEISRLMALDVAKEDARQLALAQEQDQNSQGSLIANFVEVFGAPPAAWRRHVEGILKWFDPTPSATEQAKAEPPKSA